MPFVEHSERLLGNTGQYGIRAIKLNTAIGFAAVHEEDRQADERGWMLKSYPRFLKDVRDVGFRSESSGTMDKRTIETPVTSSLPIPASVTVFNEFASMNKSTMNMTLLKKRKNLVVNIVLVVAALTGLSDATVFGQDKAKIVFLSGEPSHGPMSHEHRAGNMILADALNRSGLNVQPVLVPHPGYPEDTSILKDAATVVIFCTGHKGHLLNPHLDEFDKLMKSGTGVVMIHWATEAEKGKPGEKFLEWMGGFCDLDWSVNPHWTPKFQDFPNHPIANGLKPFSVDDEWYYHMRFVEDMKGVTPILSDLPPPETLRRPDGDRSGNPTVRRAVANGERQHVAWAYERPQGGRGFGFTGAHNHVSWQDENFRKVVLNAILWTANVEVPKDGCRSASISDSQIKENLDDKKPKN